MRTRSEGEPPRFAHLGEGLEFLRLLWGVDQALQVASKSMASTLGITGPQRLVIRIVGRFPSISAGHLAELLLVDPSTLTAVIKRLESRGILRRQVDSRDRRRKLLGLTPKGRALDVDAGGTIESAVDRLFANSSPSDISTTRRVLERLTSMIRGEATPNNRRMPSGHIGRQ